MRRYTLLHVLLSIALLCLSGTAGSADAAEIYRSVDKDGNVIYSDKPSSNAESVKVGPTNTLPEVRPREPLAPEQAPAEEEVRAAMPYATLSIIEPAQGATVSNRGGAIVVRYRLQPALLAGDSVRLLVDGMPAGELRDGALVAGGVTRGDHTLQVQVLDAAGTVVIASPNVGMTMVRPAKNSP